MSNSASNLAGNLEKKQLKDTPKSTANKLDTTQNKLDINDLTPDLILLAGVVGIEKLEELIQEYGGANFYIPKISSLDKFVERYIKNNHNKTSKQLAKELKVSENFIKKRLIKR
jgi:hypothetical protein